MLVAQDKDNKGVCVEAVLVDRLEAEGGGCGGDVHAGAGAAVADGRSEARVSDRQVVLEVRATGEGDGEGAGGRDDCDGEYNDGGGKKEKGRRGDGDKHPASSLSSSLSSFTSPGGSTPHLKERVNKNISAIMKIH